MSNESLNRVTLVLFTHHSSLCFEFLLNNRRYAGPSAPSPAAEPMLSTGSIALGALLTMLAVVTAIIVVRRRA